jgi:hypothetical protein
LTAFFIAFQAQFQLFLQSIQGLLLLGALVRLLTRLSFQIFIFFFQSSVLVFKKFLLVKRGPGFRSHPLEAFLASDNTPRKISAHNFHQVISA